MRNASAAHRGGVGLRGAARRLLRLACAATETDQIAVPVIRDRVRRTRLRRLPRRCGRRLAGESPDHPPSQRAATTFRRGGRDPAPSSSVVAGAAPRRARGTRAGHCPARSPPDLGAIPYGQRQSLRAGCERLRGTRTDRRLRDGMSRGSSRRSRRVPAGIRARKRNSALARLPGEPLRRRDGDIRGGRLSAPGRRDPRRHHRDRDPGCSATDACHATARPDLGIAARRGCERGHRPAGSPR